jgi:hypothetical protein
MGNRLTQTSIQMKKLLIVLCSIVAGILFLFALLLAYYELFMKVDSYGKYAVYKAMDDSTKYVLTIDGDDNGYTFDANYKFDLQTLVNYNEFLVDKNGAYRKYFIDGGCHIIDMEYVDLASFRVLGNSIYAKDKNHVYDCRHGRISTADVKSFVDVLVQTSTYQVTGRDKNHYYFWDEIIRDTAGFAEQFKKQELQR